MSDFTSFLKKPASVTADTLVSVCVGVVAAVASLAVLKILPFVPFEGQISSAIGGVAAAMTFIRARANLEKPSSGL